MHICNHRKCIYREAEVLKFLVYESEIFTNLQPVSITLSLCGPLISTRQTWSKQFWTAIHALRKFCFKDIAFYSQNTLITNLTMFWIIICGQKLTNAELSSLFRFAVYNFLYQMRMLEFASICTRIVQSTCSTHLVEWLHCTNLSSTSIFSFKVYSLYCSIKYSNLFYPLV